MKDSYIERRKDTLEGHNSQGWAILEPVVRSQGVWGVCHMGPGSLMGSWHHRWRLNLPRLYVFFSFFLIDWEKYLREIFHCADSHHSSTTTPQMPAATGRAEAGSSRSPGLYPSLPWDGQGPKHFGHHSLPSRVHVSRELNQKQSRRKFLGGGVVLDSTG